MRTWTRFRLRAAPDSSTARIRGWCPDLTVGTKKIGSASVCPKGGARCPQRGVRLSRSHAEEVPTKPTNHAKFRRKSRQKIPLNSLDQSVRSSWLGGSIRSSYFRVIRGFRGHLRLHWPVPACVRSRSDPNHALGQRVPPVANSN